MTSSMCAVFVCERIRKLEPKKERLVGGFFILFLSFFLSFFLSYVCTTYSTAVRRLYRL